MNRKQHNTTIQFTHDETEYAKIEKILSLISDLPIDRQVDVLRMTLGVIHPERKDIYKNEARVPRWIPKYKGTYTKKLPPSFDHARRTIQFPKVLCWEPYGISWPDLQRLFHYANEQEFEFCISGNATHYPGRTVVVLMWQKNDPPTD